MKVAWNGIGELQDAGYEKMTLSLDGVIIGSGQAAGGHHGCQMGPIVSNSPNATAYLTQNQDYTLVLNATTLDEKYHTGAFYEFQLEFITVP